MMKQRDQFTETSTRRRWLQACGATATFALAGCLDDESDGETDDSDNDETADEDNDEEPEEAFDSALDDLVENAETLQEFAENDDTDPTTSDIDRLDSRLDDAESILDSIEADADGELQERIDAVRDVVAIQRELVGYQSISVEWNNAFETAFARWEVDEYEQADEEFGDALDAIDRIGDQIDEIEAVLDEADTTALDEPELDYGDDLWTYIGIDDWEEYDAVEAFTRGLRQFNETFLFAFDGLEQYEHEEYGQAEENFSQAYVSGVNARTTFEDLENDPGTPDEIRPTAIEFRGLVDDWVGAVEYFEEAAEAAGAGDAARAESLFEDGLAELPE